MDEAVMVLGLVVSCDVCSGERSERLKSWRLELWKRGGVMVEWWDLPLS